MHIISAVVLGPLAIVPTRSVFSVKSATVGKPAVDHLIKLCSPSSLCLLTKATGYFEASSLPDGVSA